MALSSPCDHLYVTPGGSGIVAGQGITVSCGDPRVNPANNTLTRAFTAYISMRPLCHDIHVTLEKNIPIGGGLGGGSANAAALLNYLQTLPSTAGTAPLSYEKLVTLASTVGADVPFFLKGGFQRASGIGDILSPCENPFPDHFLVLVCPEATVSTAWAFSELDRQREKNKKKSSVCLTSSLHKGSKFSSLSESFQNDFESVVLQELPEIGRIKTSLEEAGANLALLSGTGSSLFGIFKNFDSAKKFMDKCSYKVYLHRL